MAQNSQIFAYENTGVHNVLIITPPPPPPFFDYSCVAFLWGLGLFALVSTFWGCRRKPTQTVKTCTFLEDFILGQIGSWWWCHLLSHLATKFTAGVQVRSSH